MLVNKMMKQKQLDQLNSLKIGQWMCCFRPERWQIMAQQQKISSFNNTWFINKYYNQLRIQNYCSILQKQYCRDGCCRLFANVAFCDVESNCLGTPTWIIILVPVVLGLAALGLVLVALIRLKSRNVEDRYVFIKKQHSKMTKMQQKQETERNFKMGVV